MAVELSDVPQGIRELLLGVTDVYTDRRPSVYCLDNTRQRLFRLDLLPVLRCNPVFRPGGVGNSRDLHHLFGGHLVQRHGTGKMPGAGIRNAEKIKRSLNTPVFSILSVKAKEHAVRQSADCKHIFTESCRAFPFSGFPDCFQIRCGMLNGDFPAETVRNVKNILQSACIVFQAQKHINKNCLVAEAPQSFADGSGGNKGNMPLRAETSAKNNDFHTFLPFGNSLFKRAVQPVIRS